MYFYRRPYEKQLPSESGFCLELKKRGKNMKLPSEPILFCSTSLTSTSCWHDDFPWGLHHSMSLLLEHYIFLKVSHVTLHSESRVLLKEKRAGGRKERHKVWQESPSETMKGDGQTWRADYRVSRTPLGLTHSQCLLPLIPQSLSPIHLPEGDKIVNGSYCCGREQAASPISYRAAVFLGLINVSDSSSQLSLSRRVFYWAPERQAVM